MRVAMPNPVSQAAPLFPVHQDMRGFDVLVDEAPLVEPGQSLGHASPKAQEEPQVQGLTEKPLKELAARVLKQKKGAALLLHQLKRPRRPSGLQCVFQLIFVAKAVEEAAGGRIRTRNDGKHTHRRRPSAVAAAADGGIAVREKGFETPIEGGGRGQRRLRQPLIIAARCFIWGFTPNST